MYELKKFLFINFFYDLVDNLNNKFIYFYEYLELPKESLKPL